MLSADNSKSVQREGVMMNDHDGDENGAGMLRHIGKATKKKRAMKKMAPPPPPQQAGGNLSQGMQGSDAEGPDW